MNQVLRATNNVSIKQIRAFLAVATTRNFSKAAEQLNLSASALSLTIRDLEYSVGRKLFERTTRSVSFTEAGSHFFPLAERLMSEFVSTINDIAQFDASEEERLAIGTSQPMLNLLIGPALADLRPVCPKLKVDLIEATTQEVIKGITSGRFDVAVTTLWTKIDLVHAIPLVEDQLGVLMPSTNPLAASDTPLSWTDIRDEPIVSYFDGAGLKARVERDPNFGHLIDRARHHASSQSGLSILMEGGYGVAIVAGTTAENFDKDRFTFRPLIDPPGWRTLYMLRHENKPLSEPSLRLIRAMAGHMGRFRNNPYIRPRQEFFDIACNAPL